MDNRQKGMLAVLAVLLLGMGGYWFAFRGDSKSKDKNADTGPVVKRQRTAVAKPKKGRTRARSGKKDRGLPTATRERETVERKSGPKRKRGSKKGTIKKKKRVPAA